MRANRFTTLFRSFPSVIGASLIAVCAVDSHGEDTAELIDLSVSEGVSTPIGDPAVADLENIFDEFTTYFESGGSDGEVLKAEAESANVPSDHVVRSSAIQSRNMPSRVSARADVSGSAALGAGSQDDDSLISTDVAVTAAATEGVEADTADTADFVGDSEGEGGVANEDSTWVRTFADTMVEDSHDVPSHSAERAVQTREGVTSFENGYIPRFEDELELVDEVSSTAGYAQAENYSRLPDSWALPPGADPARRGGISPSGAPINGFYPGGGGSLYQGGTAYGGGYFDGGYYDPNYRSAYNDPNGPYNYRLGPNDRAINDRLLYEDANFTFQGDLPLITRKFDPDDAHFKVGGIYFQAISTEVGALFSDYDGPANFRRGEEDGFLSFVGFRFRAAGRISPSFYITADVNLIYLPGANELAVRTGAGGSPILSLDYRTELGPWDIHLYDRAGIIFPFLFGLDGLDRAGRYQFGFAGFEGGSNELLFEPIWYNRFGINAQRLIQEDLRLTLMAEQADFWRTDSNIDDRHSTVQSIGARLNYEGNQVPFSPWMQYRAVSTDYFDSATHILNAGGQGRITERLSANAMAGTLWRTGAGDDNNHWLWRIGLRHEVSPRTTHGVMVGNNYFESDFSDDTVVSEFIRYYLTHQVSEVTTFSMFAQWSSDEFLTGRLVGGEWEREMYGAQLTTRFSEDLTGGLGYFYQQQDRSTGGFESERHIFMANLNLLLDRRTTAYLRYRYEEADLFDESLYMAGVRRFF